MLNNNAFVLSSFAIMWAGIVGYAWHLVRVTRTAEERLEAAQHAGGVR
jgi:hypothetical protein